MGKQVSDFKIFSYFNRFLLVLPSILTTVWRLSDHCLTTARLLLGRFGKFYDFLRGNINNRRPERVCQTQHNEQKQRMYMVFCGLSQNSDLIPIFSCATLYFAPPKSPYYRLYLCHAVRLFHLYWGSFFAMWNYDSWAMLNSAKLLLNISCASLAFCIR